MIIETFATPVEYDDVNYKSVSFIADTPNYVVLVTIEISDLFPEKQPKVIMQSLVHWGRNKPTLRQSTDYRYSPRWDNNEMAKRIRTYIKESVGPFSKICSKT